MSPIPVEYTAAVFELMDDPALARSVLAHRLYYKLLHWPRCFAQPLEVKALAFAHKLKADRADVSRALQLLIERGYLSEYSRASPRAPRRVTVNFVRTGGRWSRHEDAAA